MKAGAPRRCWQRQKALGESAGATGRRQRTTRAPTAQGCRRTVARRQEWAQVAQRSATGACVRINPSSWMFSWICVPPILIAPEGSNQRFSTQDRRSVSCTRATICCLPLPSPREGKQGGRDRLQRGILSSRHSSLRWRRRQMLVCDCSSPTSCGDIMSAGKCPVTPGLVEALWNGPRMCCTGDRSAAGGGAGWSAMARSTVWDITLVQTHVALMPR